ncbi:MAG: 3-deoxy-8-phosphooctulonate synthase [Nitrospirae bacterium RIFCSPHIGHO2_01_FULL_66_17]|nr:MAG: 3-deoxy-8-phosphooctulonate synthase [Nitrospirae bacterium RIFCSPHIGHO2_01_FULL_66_17]
MTTHEVTIDGLVLGQEHPLFVIAGPCVIENETLCLRVAERLQIITSALGIPFIFKSSYDKANRTSGASFRGLGLDEGLRILRKVNEEIGVPVLSDVHSIEEVQPAAEVLDVLQIPAFLCRQTDLVLAAMRTGKVVNIKKGQFLAPWDMKQVVDKATSTGSHRILLTERGSCFGYNNLVSDFRSLPIMRQWGYPVVFDATHSVQLPGGAGNASSGQREFVAPLARAAVAVGCDGLFMEVHPDPDRAPSDGPNMVPLDQVEDLLRQLVRIRETVESRGPASIKAR